MKKKRSTLSGNLPPVPDQEIYLNVNALSEGEYLLKIIQNNKVIKVTTFKK